MFFQCWKCEAAVKEDDVRDHDYGTCCPDCYDELIEQERRENEDSTDHRAEPAA